MSEPTPEDYEERARRADKASRAAMAGTLGLEALVVLLVPRALAATSSGLGLTKTLILVGLAVLMIGGAASARRKQGIAIGSFLQIPFLLTGIWISTMFFVGACFIAVWVRICVFRRDVVGSSAGYRMFLS
jgi:hypothetical protein